MLPDKTTKCHRTGFEKTCFQCVTEHGCRLWKHITLEFDPQTGKAAVDHYDCVDSLMDLYQKDMLRRQVQTTASVDAFRKESHAANDAHLVGAIGHLNRHMSEAITIAAPVEPQKLLGSCTEYEQ